MVVKEYMEGFLEEIFFRTKKDKKTFFISYLVYGLIMTIISVIGLKFIGINKVLLKGILIGILSLIPFMGSGILFIPWILLRVITEEKFLGSQLAILFVILCILKEISYPFLINTKYNIRPIIIAVIFLICYTIGKSTGAIVSAILVFIISTMFDAVNIQSFYRKNKIRKKRRNRTY